MQTHTNVNSVILPWGEFRNKPPTYGSLKEDKGAGTWQQVKTAFNK